MKLREKTNIEICEENHLKHTFLLNVVEESTTKNKIRATMELLAKMLCGTLGPYGSTTIVQDRDRRHLPTKDGYDLMNRVNINDEVARTVVEILRNISIAQATSVGDGTTSAIVVASSLYKMITDPANKDLFDKVAPKDIVDMLNYLEGIIVESIKNQARPVSETMEELDLVASIATNNDKDTGRLVGNLYRKIGRYGFVTTDVVDPIEKDRVDIVEGLSWKRGYIEDCFSIGLKTKKVIHDNPAMFFTNTYLTQDDVPLLADVIGECAKTDKELVIVCIGADEDARTFFKKNRTKHIASNTPELKFTVVDIDNVTASGKAMMRDLAIMTGAIVYDPLMNPEHSHPYFVVHKNEFFGRAKKAVLMPRESQIICDPDALTEDEKIAKEQLLSEIADELHELEPKKEKTMQEAQEYYDLKVEYNTLLGNSAVFHVGGKTLTERMSRERLIEDATMACRSALQNGVVYGGNLVIPYILHQMKDNLIERLDGKYGYLIDKTPRKRSFFDRFKKSKAEEESFFRQFLDLLENAFLESYKHVLENANIHEDKTVEIAKSCIEDEKFYNLKTRSFEKFSETTVINSVDTDIQILKTCVSIIGILATSNQFITLNPDMDGATR